MILLRALKWLCLLALLLIAAGTVYVGVYGWNWLREPVARLAMDKTGRALTISGNLRIDLGWPLVLIRAEGVRFGNPPWAGREHMLTADAVDFSLNLAQLVRRRLEFDVLTLDRADLHLERSADGRKNWLFDREQKNERAGVMIGRLALEQSRVVFVDPAQKTNLAAEISTRARSAAAASEPADVMINAKGQYRGLTVIARGSGGPLLALRDEGRPYPFKVDGAIGRTQVKAEGTVTGLKELQALDAEVAVRGASMAELFPVIGIVLPKTPDYRTSGRITHRDGTWRYADFYAHVGSSDMSGTVQVDTAGRKRPFLHGELTIGKLDFADLGPVIGTRSGGPAEEVAESTESADRADRVLPNIAFRADQWDSVDADVEITARTIVRDKALPIDQLTTHLRLRDSVLTLEPLSFSVAGGTLAGSVALDGQRTPIRARTKLDAKKIVLTKLMPAFKPSGTNLGEITGKFDLTGTGNSVAEMLGTADGSIGLLVNGGEMSRLMMETAGLHVLEIIALKIGGDQPIRIRCGMASLQAHAGVMQVAQLVLDTEISNIDGVGSVDFGQERLDLTLRPKSKETNLISLRSPIYVRGTFADPEVDVDRARLAVRGLGALALGIANPLLALAPLVEAGPGLDSDCGRLLEQARDATKPQEKAATPDNKDAKPVRKQVQKAPAAKSGPGNAPATASRSRGATP